MKIAIKTPESGWILDEIANDFVKKTSLEVVKDLNIADIIWCVDVFSVKNILQFSGIKVVSFHHLNKECLHEYDFRSLNMADYFIVPNEITKRDISSYITKPVIKLPYWLLSKMTNKKDIDNLKRLRTQLCPNNELLIGSFIKDGNGNDGKTPKVSKNPDLLLMVLERLREINIKVLLSGYAREYVISGLKKLKIPYIYYPKYENIDMLYDCLDWYLVTSKYEGGPQSILEASFRDIKILSTNVGMVSDVLHKDCICSDCMDFVNKIKSNVCHREYNRDMVVNNYMPEIVIPMYDKLFKSIY